MLYSFAKRKKLQIYNSYILNLIYNLLQTIRLFTNNKSLVLVTYTFTIILLFS